MALSYSNVLGNSSATNALTSMINNPTQLSTAALANAKTKGIGSNLAVTPLTTPKTSLPSGNQPGGVVPLSTYNQGVSLGKISPASSGTSDNAAAINKAHKDTLAALTSTGNLTQQQLDAQNAASGKTQFNTEPAQSGGAIGSSDPATPATNLASGTGTNFGGLVGNLVGAGQGATNIAAQYGQQIADVGKAGAAAQGGYLTTGTTPVAEGRAAVVAQTTAAQQQALASGESAALQGTGQQINASGTAAGLAKPEVTSPGQAVFNPLTGTYTSASSGGSQSSTAPSGIDQNSWNQYIQDYATGNFGAIPSSITGNANLSGQLQQAVGAANPGFNYNSALGAGQGATTAAATAGGIESAQAQQIASYKSAQQQGQNLASQLNDLISTFGLNPSDVNAVNIGIQKIAQNTSNPQYQILSNYLNDVAARYAQVLTPPGGSSTDTTRAIATGMLNATASGTSISQVLKSLDTQASAVIAGIPATGSVPGGSSSGTSGGSYQNGSTVSAGGYNFVYQNGAWVAQ